MHPQGSGRCSWEPKATFAWLQHCLWQRHFPPTAQNWVSFPYESDILLQDSFGLFKPTLIVLQSFLSSLLAGAPARLCAAALKDNTNDTDQLLLQEAFLDQLCCCSSIPGSTKQVSAAGRGYFWDDLQWL